MLIGHNPKKNEDPVAPPLEATVNLKFGHGVPAMWKF
jgi:hypothetical protein